jgi:hypothetical protein
MVSLESYRLRKMIMKLNKRPGSWKGWKSHWKKIMVSFLLVFPPKPCTYSSSPYLTNSTSYEASHYVKQKKKYSVALVRKRTIPTERPQLVGEVSAKFCG